MTNTLPKLEPLDPQRVPEGQSDWGRALLEQYADVLNDLSRDERVLYLSIWRHLARHNSPATARQFTRSNQGVFQTRQMIISLHTRSLLWYDPELHGILQCAPFSALHTPHQIKAFGWEMTYACSFVDIPLTLFVYGPNCWVEAHSTCPRSGERLSFRLMMREDGTIEVNAPDEAARWCVWLPLPSQRSMEAYGVFNALRPKIQAFYSLQDLETHREYQTDASGVIYSFDQAIYLGSRLLSVYSAISRND